MFSLRPVSIGACRSGRARTPGTRRTIAAASRRYAGNAGIMMRKKLASSTDAGMYVPLSEQEDDEPAADEEEAASRPRE